MGDTTGIAWTDHTFNPWIGCSKVHTGCKNCYAETLMATRYGKVTWGPNGTRMLTSPANWAKPLKWNRDAKAAGVRHRVFCASLADVFEDWSDKPVLDHQGHVLVVDGGIQRRTLQGVRDDLFDLIDETPHLDWQILTKRPENVTKMWPLTPGIPKTLIEFDDAGKAVGYKKHDRITQLMFRPNVWIGTSVSNQETADKQIPELLKLRDLSPVLFLSAEPLLGPVSFRWAKWHPLGESATGHLDGLSELDWIIVGGESGPGARMLRVEWDRKIIEQCREAGVPCFNKQLGEFIVDRNDSFGYEDKDWNEADDQQVEYDIHGFRENFQGADCRIKLRDKKGGDMNEWPQDLRVRQFPNPVSV